LKLLKRVLRRSGTLSFDEVTEIGGGEDVRLKWLSRLNLKPHAVIDFGCWTGTILSAIDATERVGLDLPGPWLEEARKRQPGSTFVAVQSLTSLPPGLEAKFDLALFLETLEHIPRATEKLVLHTIYESLAPDGTLILATPAAGLAALLDPAWILVGHRHYRANTVRRLLGEVGFGDVAIQFSGNVYTSFDALAMYFRKHLLHRPHVPSSKMRSRVDTGLRNHRGIGTAGVWAIARK
jgi:SAM-dependent methyltransferase